VFYECGEVIYLDEYISMTTHGIQYDENSSTMLGVEKARLDALHALEKLSLHSEDAYWSSSFVRHKGIFTNTEQRILRHATVAIAGLGAIGGNVFLGLVRVGIGRFIIADFDTFESSNINRQNGARPETLGRHKIDVLLEEAYSINPYIEVTLFPKGITPETIKDFLHTADVVVDAMDFFAYRVRLHLLTMCRTKKLFVISSGNTGFGASLLIFDPKGIDINNFLGVSLTSSDENLMAAFALAWVPRQLSSNYIDPSYVSIESKVGPATNIAALSAASMIMTEVTRLILKKKGLKPVPRYVQIDPYNGKYIESTLWFGNKGIWQRIRRYVLIHHFWGRKKGFKPVPPPGLPQMRVMHLPVPDDCIRAIITAGIQAPSGDNIQPWLFYGDGNTFHIAIDEAIDHSYFNYKQIPSLISAGAVLENMKIAAKSYGLETVFESVGGEARSHVATISFTPSDSPRDPLFNAIWERNTNRRLYSGEIIPQSIQRKLKETAVSFPGVRYHEISDKRSLQILARAIYLVDILRSERKDLHEHMQKMIRFTQKKVYSKRDGFPLRNLKAGWHGELFLRFTHPWWVMKILNRFGIAKAVAQFSYNEIISSSTCVLLTVPTLSSHDCITAGRALERMWLEAQDNDLSFQPMVGLPMFTLRKKFCDEGNLSSRHKKLLKEAESLMLKVFPELDPHKEQQVMLFRLGYAQAIEVGTLRRDVDSFVK